MSNPIIPYIQQNALNSVIKAISDDLYLTFEKSCKHPFELNTYCELDSSSVLKSNNKGISYMSIDNIDLKGARLSSQIGFLTDLEYLNLGWPIKDGSALSKISQLTNLNYLAIQYNGFYNQEEDPIESPNAIYNLTKLNNLIIYANNFTGNLSTYISKLSNLTNLEIVANTRLNFQNFSYIGKLKELKSLTISTNKYKGLIPPEISNCANLIYLNLSGDEEDPTFNYNGTIPTELGNLSQLQNLRYTIII